MKCLSCQCETENPKFCSRSCAAKYTNKIPKRKLSKTCAHKDCGCIIRNHRSSLCEKHYQDNFQNKKEFILNTTLGEYRERNKHLHPSSANVQVRGFARFWFKDLTKMPCAFCSYDKHVELCHIKAVASFDDSSLIRDVNHKDNIIQLCPNCHWEFDNGLRKIGEAG